MLVDGYCTMYIMQPDPIVSPEVYVDSVIFQLLDDELAILLTQRIREPFRGRWALPGSNNPVGETTHHAMARILTEKTGLRVSSLEFIEQLYTFDTVTRDPRGHAISVVYLGLGKNLVPRANSKTIKNAQFFSMKHLPDHLAFDHDHIIHYAHQRLAGKLSYTNAVFALLPKLFTLSQLQTAYEAVHGKKFDKRNFRKKYLSFDLISPTNEYHMEGAHRPAKLYKFNKQHTEYLSRSFD